VVRYSITYKRGLNGTSLLPDLPHALKKGMEKLKTDQEQLMPNKKEEKIHDDNKQNSRSSQK